MRLPFWRRSQRQGELEQEIRSHLQMAAGDRAERGEPAEYAEQAARREFGNVAVVEQVTRDQWPWVRLEEFLQDYAGAVVLVSHDRAFLDRVTSRTIEIANRTIEDYP